MQSDLLGGSGAEDVSPELLAFLQRPGIGALIDRDDELGNGAQDLEELCFCGFHYSPELNANACREKDAPSLETASKELEKQASTFAICLLIET